MEVAVLAVGAILKWKLASAGVKIALKAFLPKQEPLRDLLGASLEALIEHLKTPAERDFVEAIRNRVAADLPAALGIQRPEQAREDAEVQEALSTLLDTVDRAGEAAALARLDPQETADALVELAHQNPRWKWLRVAQQWGCETVLRGIAAEIAPRAALFGGFDETTARDTLNGVDQLLLGHQEVLTRLDHILNALPADPRSEAEREDRQFEFRYRQVLGSHLDRLELFGIDEVEESARRYPLSIAFVRLRLVQHGETQGPGTDLRAEEVLAGQERLLILGEAGSGKSTLLQWLTVHAAAGDLTGELASWNHCVPFFLRLRHCVPDLRQQRTGGKRVSLPSLSEWVSLLSGNLRDAMPSGWVDRQIKASRALVLVDGVDEVPEEFHEAVRSWVQELRTLGVQFLAVSSRPQLQPSWLRGFTEWSVVPLDLGAALDLVNRWHAAVEIEEPRAVRRAEIPARREALKTALSRPGPLRELMHNPLLCAMLCALNYRGSRLPHGRIELYEACCRALIHEREASQQIVLSQSLAWMTLRHKHQMLGNLAYWMVDNGYSEALAADVDRRLQAQLELIPRTQLPPEGVRPEEVRQHFVQRSGLLREPVPGETVQFVHKTFMEFFAAREAVDQENYGVLLKHADRPEWAGVIRFAAGFVPNLEKSRRLFQGLLAESSGSSIRRQLLAVSCLETCTLIDPALQERLTAVLGELVPPCSEEAVQAMAGAGPLALSFLALRSEWEESSRAWCITALARIGGEDALLLLADYAKDAGEQSREALVRAWSYFEAGTYAHRVLALALCGCTSFRPEGAVSLAGLEALPWLDTLDLSGCPAVTDLSPVSALRLLAFINKDGAPMVWVPPGEFTMGGTDDNRDAEDNEWPAGQVRITRGYWLSQTPVTNAQYRRFVQANRYTEPQFWHYKQFRDEAQPVVGVSWDDAVAYCNWAGGRLPTEAEWEYAARGPESRRYPWGDAQPTPQHADFGQDGAKGRPQLVGSMPLGAAWCRALDLVGNVWEWCADWYDGKYYRQAPECDPSGPTRGRLRAVRGGSWVSTADSLRPALRSYYHPGDTVYYLGFRCVVEGGADHVSEPPAFSTPSDGRSI